MRNKVGCLKFVLSLLVCIVALCISISPALAQSSSTGALTGVVSDPSGAVIVGATVTATNIGTGESRTTATNATGTYLISLLPPGDYSVKFEAPGFQSSQVPSVTVNVTETPVLNHNMVVGSQTQQVTVESTAESIQTENATVGSLVGSHEVTALPLSTRNYTQIVDLSPGVATNVAEATNFGIGTQDVNVNGSSSEHNNYQMEGASIVNYISGKAGQENTYGSIPVPSPDAIQEFKVQTSQFDASYGRNSGGNVNVVLKTGTNNFHGDAWEFNRNNFFNANDFFNKITEVNTHQPNSPQTLKQNTFGATLGGPLKKDKLFFFGEFQGLRQVNGVVSQGYSPGVNLPNINDYADVANGTCANVRCTTGTNPVAAAAAYRTFLGSTFGGVPCPTIPVNDFTGPGGTCVNPGSGPETAGATIAGSGPQIALNGSNINQVSINWLQAMSPLAGYNQGFFVAGAPQTCAAPCQLNIEDPADASENQYLINTDYHISDKNTFSERYMYSYLPETIPFGSTMPGSPNAQDFRTDFAVLRLTTILNDNTVNEARVSFNRITTHLADLWNIQSCAIGVIPDVANAVAGSTTCPALPAANPDLYLLPTLTISGTAATGTYPVGLFSIGGAGQTSSDVATNQYQAGEQLSWNHGKQSFRFGGDYERAQVNWLLPATERGSVTFRTFQDFLYGGSTGTASALSAVGGSHSVPTTGPFYAVRGNTIDAYIQDDIKLKSNLTVNIGTRWEYDGLPLGTNTGYLTGDWPVLLNSVNTGSFFNLNPQGTLAGYVMQSKYPLAPVTPVGPSFGLVSPTGATGVYINSNNSIIPNSAPKDVFSPRIGFAWQPKMFSHMVVRGGYGWFHDRPLASIETKSVAGASPRTVPLNSTTLATRTIVDPFPPSFQGTNCITDLSPTGGCPLLGFVPRTLAAPTSIAGIEPTYMQPLVQEYNLGIQYALKGGWVASVGYVGSHGIHLLTSGVDQNIDYLIAGAPNTPMTGLFNEVPQGALPYNDVLNVASVSCPTCGPVTTNNGPGASAVSTNQIERARYLGLNPVSGYAWTGTDGDSLYDSLQASVQHQFSHGLTLNIAYTWSKLITDISGGLATTGAAQNENGNLIEGGHNSDDPLNTAQQYGLATYNRPQRIVVSYSYELPFKSENGIMNKVVSGWAINGVTTVQDGLPLILTDPAGGTIYGSLKTAGLSRAELADPVDCNSFGQCYSGVPVQTPGRIENRYNCYFEFATSHCGTTKVGGGVLPVVAAIAPSGSEPLIGGTPSGAVTPSPSQTVDGITSGCYGATPAFTASTCGTYYGNSRMSIARSPSQFNFDMALSKQIPVTEGTHLEFRAEAFNVFNHTQFNTPASLAVNSSSFGVITSTSVPPRILQFGLKFVF